MAFAAKNWCVCARLALAKLIKFVAADDKTKTTPTI